MRSVISHTKSLFRDPHTEIIKFGAPTILFASACLVIETDWWVRLPTAIILFAATLFTILGVDAGARLCILESSRTISEEAMAAIANHIFGNEEVDLAPIESIEKPKFSAPPSHNLH